MNIYMLEVFIISCPVDGKCVKKNPVLSRTIVIRGDQTLAQLHEIIFKAFDRFDEHLYKFQIGGKSPHDTKSRRHGFPSYPDEISNDFKLAGDVKQTTLDVLKLKQDQSFGYWFDFGDDWWRQVNAIEIEQKTPKGKYPKITKRIGESPSQYVEIDK